MRRDHNFYVLTAKRERETIKHSHQNVHDYHWRSQPRVSINLPNTAAQQINTMRCVFFQSQRFICIIQRVPFALCAAAECDGWIMDHDEIDRRKLCTNVAGNRLADIKRGIHCALIDDVLTSPSSEPRIRIIILFVLVSLNARARLCLVLYVLTVCILLARCGRCCRTHWRTLSAHPHIWEMDERCIGY